MAHRKSGDRGEDAFDKRVDVSIIEPLRYSPVKLGLGGVEMEDDRSVFQCAHAGIDRTPLVGDENDVAGRHERWGHFVVVQREVRQPCDALCARSVLHSGFSSRTQLPSALQLVEVV